MSFTEDNFKQQQEIEQFLKGQLSQQEAARFESKVNNDPELARDVEFYSNLKFTLKNAELIKANQSIKAVMSQKALDPDFDLKGIDAFKNPWWGGTTGLLTIGVLVMGLLASVFFINQQSNRLSPQPELSQEYLTPFESLIATSSEEETPLSLGIDYYNQGNYSEAINWLNRYLAGEPNEGAQLYLGISYLMQGEVQNALETLTPVVDEEGIFSPPAQWYLALTYINLGDLETARTLLQKLQGDPVFEERGLSELLEQL